MALQFLSSASFMLLIRPVDSHVQKPFQVLPEDWKAAFSSPAWKRAEAAKKPNLVKSSTKKNEKHDIWMIC